MKLSNHHANFTSCQLGNAYYPRLPDLSLPAHLRSSTLLSHTSFNMTHKLPPNLLALFAAPPALRKLPPSHPAPEERKTNNIGGNPQYLSAVEDYKENVPYEPTESWLQRKDRLKLEKKDKQEQLIKQGTPQMMRFVDFSFPLES